MKKWALEIFRSAWQRHSIHFQIIRNCFGRAENFTINVREVYINAGAGFVVVLTGKVLTMPGLPKKPAAYGIDFDEENNKIVGIILEGNAKILKSKIFA